MGPLLKYNNKVICFPPRTTWTFHDFVYENGKNPVREWFTEHEEAGDQFVKILKDCAKTEDHTQWGLKRLNGEFRSLWEFRYYSEDKQHRVIMQFGPGRKAVVLLAGCYHKGKVYTPANALQTALSRSRMLECGEGKTHERKIKEDI